MTLFRVAIAIALIGVALSLGPAVVLGQKAVAAAPPDPAAAAATGAEPAPSAAVMADDILDKMSANERRLYTRMQEMTPRVETYMQNLRADPHLGEVPIADRYYLGILHFAKAFQTVSFLPSPQAHWRQWIGPLDDLLAWPGRKVLGLDVYRSSFAAMLFPGGDHFDRQHYRFSYVRQEFLGQVRCYVFDVVPLSIKQRGSFWGRIWIEDREDHLVRFNGSFWQDRYGHPDLHFDSWRINVKPGLWLPAYIYTEESDLGYGLYRQARFQAQTRLWGYNLRLAGDQQSLTSIEVEGAEVAPAATASTFVSPLASMRAWERQAEDNVLNRLERAGLLAPAGPADTVLDTVVNNLIVSNKLSITPAVRCRILLTTPLESLTIGHTIVLSRGLIDSLPNEASLAAMLAHELAQIDLGERLDTRYAFYDRMLFADQDAYRLLDLKRTPEEETEANVLAVKLLKASPYHDHLASAGLFLREVAARRTDTPHLGNGWFSHDYLSRLRALESAAPALHPAQVNQIAALPLGSRLQVNPWDGSLKLMPPAGMTLLSASDKMPLQLTPFFPYLQRVSAPAQKSSTPEVKSGHSNKN